MKKKKTRTKKVSKKTSPHFAKDSRGKKKITPKTNFPTSSRFHGTGGIIPLGDRILLKPFSEEEVNTTSSGIIIPDTVSKEKPEQGRVMAVGEGRLENGKRVTVSVKVGDKVVFSRYGYEEVKYEGVEYYILKEENILAVIN